MVSHHFELGAPLIAFQTSHAPKERQGFLRTDVISFFDILQRSTYARHQMLPSGLVILRQDDHNRIDQRVSRDRKRLREVWVSY